MGGRVRSNAKIAPGLRGHVSKAGASFSGARRGPYMPAWLHGQPAFAVPGDVATAGTAGAPIPPIPPAPTAADETPAPIDLPALLLGILFLAVLVGVSTIRL